MRSRPRPRLGHPTATLDEIEAAVDERLHGLRARSACPAFGTAMQGAGTEVWRLTTAGDRPLELRRTRLRCPSCGVGRPPPR